MCVCVCVCSGVGKTNLCPAERPPAKVCLGRVGWEWDERCVCVCVCVCVGVCVGGIFPHLACRVLSCSLNPQTKDVWAHTARLTRQIKSWPALPSPPLLCQPAHPTT